MKEIIMVKKREDSGKRTRKKSHDTENEMARLVRQAGFGKEITELLIKEIEEICDFEDSLDEF